MNEELSRVMELAGLREYIHDFSDRKRNVEGPFIVSKEEAMTPPFRPTDEGRPYLKLNGRISFYPSLDAAKKAKLTLII
jgi:hypothetical protein